MNNYFDIKGKVALVTGATSGLGKGYAEMLAEQGAEVVLLGRREKLLQEIEKSIVSKGGHCRSITCDITKNEDVVDKLGTLHRVDILINNAGVTEKSKDITDYTEEQWERVISTNLSGTYRVSREVCKVMKRQNYGKIINISSILAAMGACNQTGYIAAKGGVISLTRAMAVELSPYQITVNAILPGYCMSEMTDLQSRGCRYFTSRMPLGRVGTAEDLCGAVLLFASDASRWMTGCILPVDGGHTANL